MKTFRTLPLALSCVFFAFLVAAPVLAQPAVIPACQRVSASPCVLLGPGNDVFNGGPGGDCVNGGGGNDTISTFGGQDIAGGGPGNDTIDGGDQDDCLRGHGGNDSIRGGGGSDELIGGAGTDALDGGPGASDYCRSGELLTAACEFT